MAESRHYPYGGERWTSGAMPTDYRWTGQRSESSLGLYQMGARFYDPALGRWLSPDVIVPGAATSSGGGGAATLGYNDQVRLTPLTVGFHETQFLSVVGEENREIAAKGFWFQRSEREKAQSRYQWGPSNPQALNRYAYCLGNPLRYVDPSGHAAGGNEDVGYEQVFDEQGNPLLDANGNAVWRVWYFGEELYISGDNPDLDKFIFFAEGYSQAQGDWGSALIETGLGVAGGAAGVILLIAAGTGEAVSFGVLTIPAGVVAGAGVVSVGVGVAATGKAFYDLVTAFGDIGRYSYNAHDMFNLMKASPYNRTQFCQWWLVHH